MPVKTTFVNIRNCSDVAATNQSARYMIKVNINQSECVLYDQF